MKTPAVGQTLGKYRILAHLASGGFAKVYRAQDTIEGIQVALKVPHPEHVAEHSLDDFLAEVRIASKLEHPNILPLKDASYIGDLFIVAYPLGRRTLSDAMTEGIKTAQALNYARQMLAALAYAHSKKVLHCDLKPDNFILFAPDRVRLADFGLAKVTLHSVWASGSGTLGYMAPEQAMGRPALPSDVFALALVLYELLCGQRPEWPFRHPLPVADRLRRRVGKDLQEVLHRALRVEAKDRYRDAQAFERAFLRCKIPAEHGSQSKISAARRRRRRADTTETRWRTQKRRDFLRRFRKVLGLNHECPSCSAPMSETMTTCPWCSKPAPRFKGEVSFPDRCPRCRRGMKLDWRFCPWCYGPAVGPKSERSYSDVRYQGRCQNAACSRKLLMPFMRYCPWCRRKVRRPWLIADTKDRCPKCRWSVLRDFWKTCPWCATDLHRAG